MPKSKFTQFINRHPIASGIGVMAAAVLIGEGSRRLSHQPGLLGSLHQSPKAITSPAKLSVRGWKSALRETIKAITNKDLSMQAAGVSYFATLAFFPTLVSVISIYSLAVKPEQILSATRTIGGFMPPEMARLIITQLSNSAGSHHQSLIAAVVATLIAVFSASSGMQNLIKALNRAYDVTDHRGFVRLRALSLVFVLAAIALGLPVAALLLAQHGILSLVRWPVLALVTMLALSVTYRYAPDRPNPRWQIVSWGGAVATIIWLLGTAVFFLYVHYLANFSRTYGVFAGIVILMTWLNLSALIVLIGAEVNNRLERATGGH